MFCLAACSMCLAKNINIDEQMLKKNISVLITKPQRGKRNMQRRKLTSRHTSRQRTKIKNSRDHEKTYIPHSAEYSTTFVHQY